MTAARIKLERKMFIPVNAIIVNRNCRTLQDFNAECSRRKAVDLFFDSKGIILNNFPLVISHVLIRNP